MTKNRVIRRFRRNDVYPVMRFIATETLDPEKCVEAPIAKCLGTPQPETKGFQVLQGRAGLVLFGILWQRCEELTEHHKGV